MKLPPPSAPYGTKGGLDFRHRARTRICPHPNLHGEPGDRPTGRRGFGLTSGSTPR